MHGAGRVNFLNPFQTSGSFLKILMDFWFCQGLFKKASDMK